ncbi:hypothetical protein [Thiomicrorhabdus sp. Milos-T2]|uniref:hypothetical protein n=1 Tax=Thiomicrorhabdus sp. Milos-T2 TaxID=90814 RepID=UPI00049408A7|nr:hypothetical protein [Thiomicrorhabdus sp. Milos-T2]
MNIKVITLSTLITLISATPVYAQNDIKPGEKVYPIESRLNDYTRPTTFTPQQANPVNGAISENIVTTTQRILNKEAPFLKKGVVKALGVAQSSPWEMVSDEGGESHHQTAPNPLTYYAAGISSSLLTQIERGIKVLDLNVENVKIESKIYFRWADTMTNKWSGYTDKVVSNILIKSNESPEKIKALKDMAIKAWAVGEGLANKTTIDAGIVVNADSWSGQKPSQGRVDSPVSIEKGFKLTNITPDLKLKTLKVEDDLAVDMHHLPNPLLFSEISIVESANDADRPYMHRVRAKSLTQNYKTWELYSDDSRGYAGVAKAPTSWEYFTIGTSFCLMSQLTPNQMYFQKQGVKIDDYRVEHQFNYQQDNFMTPTMTGYLNDVITRVIVKSDASKADAERYAKQSLRTCFAGEGIMNKTEMQTNVYLNGHLVE